MKNILCVMVALIFACGLAPKAHAVPITIDFTGSVSSVGAGLLDGVVSIDDIVTGLFAYDTSTLDSNSSDTYGSYAGQTFSIQFESVFSASSSNISIRTYENAPGLLSSSADGMWVGGSTASGDTLNGRSVNAFAFGLLRKNDVAQLMPDDFLLDASDWANVSLADINLPDWHWMQFTRLDADSSIFDSQIRWDITSFSVTSLESPAPVPEPSTVLLLGSGLVALAWYGRKRKKA